MANDLGAILIVNYDLSLSFVVSRGQRLFYGAVPIQSRHHSEFIWYSLFLVFKFIFLAPILDPLIHIHTFSQYFGSIITYSFFGQYFGSIIIYINIIWPPFCIHYYIFIFLARFLDPLLHIYIFGQYFGFIIIYIHIFGNFFWILLLHIYVHKI